VSRNKGQSVDTEVNGVCGSGARKSPVSTINMIHTQYARTGKIGLLDIRGRRLQNPGWVSSLKFGSGIPGYLVRIKELCAAP
jgi:hypothetical protein